MATPTQNSVPVTYFNPSLYPSFSYLLEGVKWGGALGQGVQLTWHRHSHLHLELFREDRNFGGRGCSTLSGQRQQRLDCRVARWGQERGGEQQNNERYVPAPMMATPKQIHAHCTRP